MYPVHDALQRLDRRLREHAVPEVEDVARAARGPVEHVADSLLELGERREQRRRIEVSLNRPVGTDALPRDVEGNAPVHADDVAARAREVGEEHGGVGPEMDHGDARRAGQLERPLTVGKHVRRIVRRRQAADPAVEQLQRPRAGARLGGEVGADQLREPQHQLVPGSGLGVHEPLGQGEAARRAAFDGVAREREGRAGEADERDVRGKRAGREPRRVHHVREIGGWLDARQLEDLGRFMNRAGDVRSLARREAEAEAEGLERQQDVGEENRGVHAQPLDRLEGDPGGELGCVTQLEQRVLLSQRAVLREVPPRLSHEPHRRDVGGLRAARFQEAAVVRGGGQPWARAPRPER